MSRSWYRVALARAGRPVEVVAASGEHVGQAIAEARDHVDGSWPVAVATASGQDIPLGESVGKGHVLVLPGAPDVPVFGWPSGVLPSLPSSPEAGQATLAGAASGWIVRPDPTLLVVEAQADRERLADLFLGLVERLPSGDNLEVRVMDHFEDAGATDVWLTSRVDVRQIVRFVDDHDVDLLDSGHVELGVYVRKLKGTLRLTEHKTVVWLAEGRALEAELAAWLGELGVPRVERLVTVRDGAHVHYRPAGSRDRTRLGEQLYRHRLRKVDSVKRG